MPPCRGDLVVIRYHDLTGAATGDATEAKLATDGEQVGWWVGYRTMTSGGRRVRFAVVGTVKWPDGTIEGWHATPRANIDSVAVVRRRRSKT